MQRPKLPGSGVLPAARTLLAFKENPIVFPATVGYEGLHGFLADDIRSLRLQGWEFEDVSTERGAGYVLRPLVNFEEGPDEFRFSIVNPLHAALATPTGRRWEKTVRSNEPAILAEVREIRAEREARRAASQ